MVNETSYDAVCRGSPSSMKLEDTMDTVKQSQISQVRVANLLKEIYTGPQVIANSELEELLPRYEDAEEQRSEDERALEFDQIEVYYDSFSEYMKVKHQMLQSYMHIKSEQVSFSLTLQDRKSLLKKTDSNDIISSIKNSLSKHCGVHLNFDVQKAQASYLKAAT